MNEPAACITRPDGKPYRPRKVVAHAIVDEDGLLCGVMVLGTHDVTRAQALADWYAVWQLGSGHAAAGPRPGWYRDGYECGHRCWVTDEVHGRAGVWFRKITERGEPDGTVADD